MAKQVYADRRGYRRTLYLALDVIIGLIAYLQYNSGHIDISALLLFFGLCLLFIGRDIGAWIKFQQKPVITYDGKSITLRLEIRPALAWPQFKSVTFRTEDIVDFRVVERWWGIRDDYVLEVDHDKKDAEYIIQSSDLYPKDRSRFIELCKNVV